MSRLCVYLALTTVAIAQPILGLYGSQLSVFTSAQFEGMRVVWFALVMLVGPALILFALDIALSLTWKSRGLQIHYALVLVGHWAATSALLRSLSLNHWTLDLMLTGAVAVLLTVLYAQRVTVRAWLLMMSPMAAVVAAVFVVSASSIVFLTNADAEGKFEASTAAPNTPLPTKDISVLWLVLDEAPLFPLLNTDGRVNANRFPGFAALANESTWYRNTVATTQRTSEAVPAMLTGAWPVIKTQPVFENYPRNLFTLMAGNKDLDVNEMFALCPTNLCPSKARPRTSFPAFMKDSLIVLGHTLFPADLRGTLPPIDEGWGNFQEPKGTENGIANFSHVTEIQNVQKIIDRAATTKKPTVHFSHALIPHRPWDIAADLRMSSTMSKDPRKNSSVERLRDNYQAHVRQYVATDTLVGEMVATLKKSNNWDRTMVIVTSDHGLTFTPGESLRDKINPKNRDTLEDIFRVPLFIKYPQQQSAAVNDCPVSSVDLLPTVSAATGISAGWITDGVDLLSKCPVRTSRTVKWFGGETSVTSGIDELMLRVMHYNKWIPANGNAADIYKTGRSGSLLGTRTPSEFNQSVGLAWTLNDADAFQKVGANRFEFVPTRAAGRIILEATVPADTEGLIAIDGVFVGVVSELSGASPSEPGTFYSSALDPQYIGKGAHTVEMWTAQWTNNEVQLSRVGPPSR